jgi:catechol 2,3-dioxygenase-like lactoylglutathione lyase family enzyme
MTGQHGQHGQLHHVEIYVDDLRGQEAFWGWFLGMLGYREYQRWEQGVSYRLGPTYLVFVQTEERFLESRYHRCRPGMNHLAFHAASAAVVDDVRAALRERGVRMLYDDRFPHAGGPDSYAVFFEDPMRMKVELVAEV